MKAAWIYPPFLSVSRRLCRLCVRFYPHAFVSHVVGQTGRDQNGPLSSATGHPFRRQSPWRTSNPSQPRLRDRGMSQHKPFVAKLLID